MSESQSVVRWGILGTAEIARTALIPAVRETEDGQVRAVGSRDGEKARRWAEENQIPQAHGSYEAVLEDPEVDAVYIPLPNSLHVEWIIKAAKAGKHIFCEKPLSMTYEEAVKAAQAAEDAGVLLAEAFVWFYHRQTQHVRRLIDSGAIGEVRHVDARFHYQIRYGPENIRLRPEVGGGAFMDVGCYVLSYARWAMGEPPEAIAASMTPDRHGTGVDESFSATLRFSGGRTANISAGIRMHGGQWAAIYGSEAFLELTEPFHPRSESSARVRLKGYGKESDESFAVSEPPFTDALRAFQRSVRTGEPLPIPAVKDLLEQAKAMDACRRSAEEQRWVVL